MTIGQFICEYWYIIVAFIAVIAFVAIEVYKWIQLPDSEQKAQVRQWLLFAVAKAEAELGTGTGQLKLSRVYDMFLAKFPAIALFISFEEFSAMVDSALEELEDLIDNSDNIASAIKENKFLEG